MSQNTLIGIVIAIIVIIAGAFLVTRTASAPVENAENTQVETATTTSETPAPAGDLNVGADVQVATQPAAVTVTYSDSGFSPKEISVPVGTSVRFVNNSSRQMWVGSAMHPAHAAYDGTTLQQHCATLPSTSFDQCAATGAGTSYSFTFTKAGTFGYHNHVQASDFGRVTVTQ